MTERLHSITPAHHPTSAGLSPIGLPCDEHGGVTVGGLCYWHAKTAARPSTEQETFAGWRDPFTERPAYRAQHGPKWRAAVGEALAALVDDELDQYDPRAPRMGEDELATLRALIEVAPGGLEEAV
jgi:hypothetical protein